MEGEKGAQQLSGPDGGEGGYGGGAAAAHTDPPPSADPPPPRGLASRDDSADGTIAKIDEEHIVTSKEDGKSVDCDGSNADAVNGHRKRRVRRKNKGGKHHRKWRPYNKLTWDERKVLDERETKRAQLRRDERFASGQAMAPYNTTQFLMEEHQGEMDLARAHLGNSGPAGDREASGSGAESSDGVGSYDGDGSPNDDEIFMEADFNEAFESFQAERLQQMTKDELVREYLALEGKVDSLEKQVKDLQPDGGGLLQREKRSSSAGSGGGGARLGSDEASVDLLQASHLEKEIRKLREENDKLKNENQHLKADNKVVANI